jgi:phosphate transport system substrate-binding protein
MKRLFLKSTAAAAIAFGLSTPVFAADITGAGATFPYPIYAKWAEAYKKATGVGLNYQSIGSSGGIRQIRAKTVAFGATDAPVAGDVLDKDGMVQFPAIIGGTVPVFNLDGFAKGELRVTGPVLAEMFMGKIAKWNDPKLAALNPGKKLPNQNITIVHRADGSGTTFNWTDYLASVSKEWADTVGKGAAVKWPAASSVGGKGNEGVAANVSRIKGSLGYVEYAYAKQNRMSHTQLRNRDGAFVQPDDDAYKSAAAGADWSRSFFQVLTDQPGAASWPITGATFILMHKQQDKPVSAANALKFFDWAFTNGDKMAEELTYVPLPANVKDMIRKQWADNLKDSAGKPISFR